MATLYYGIIVETSSYSNVSIFIFRLTSVYPPREFKAAKKATRGSNKFLCNITYSWVLINGILGLVPNVLVVIDKR